MSKNQDKNSEKNIKKSEAAPTPKKIIKKKLVAAELPVINENNLSKRRKARILAMQTLYNHEFNTDLSIDELCKFSWVDDKISQDVAEFAALLVRGTLEKKNEIDEIIIPKLQNWIFSRVSPVNKAILRISIYSILYLKDVPRNVTINEAVDLGKMFSDEEGYKFINAILDKIT